MDTLAVLFSDTYDDRLKEIISPRTMASIPYGGRYRAVDFILSSLVNSGIHDIGIITKTNYGSLMDHLGSGKDWGLSRRNGGLTILPPFLWNSIKSESRGKLDALIGIRNYLIASTKKYVVLSDCNVIKYLDIEAIKSYHIEKKADITIVYQSIPSIHAPTITVKCDLQGRVYDIISHSSPKDSQSDVGLGVYIMEREKLLEVISMNYLEGECDFEKHFLERNIKTLNIFGYKTTGYTSILNTVNDYFEANMDMLNENVRKELFYSSGKVYTKVKETAPTLYTNSANVTNSLVADGCIIEGNVHNSIIFRGVKINSGATVSNCIIMQHSVIGENAQMQYVIADKDVVVSNKRVINGTRSHPVVLGKGSTE